MAPPVKRRRWEELPGRNKFCLEGRVMMSRQTGVFYFTLVLILGTMALFFYSDSPYLWQHTGVFYFTLVLILGTMALFFYSDSPYLWQHVSPVLPLVAGLNLFLVLSNLLRTSFSDPGVIPRATAAEAADTEHQINAELLNGDSAANTVNGYRPPPRMREVSVRGQAMKLKYCFSCKLFRPPRSSHCSICDNCILNFDHHCPWVGNCVGLRNYRHFYLFIATLSFLCVYTFGCVVLHIVLMAQKESFLDAVKASPGSLVVALICFFSIWSVLGLAGFHSYLLASAQTTNEDIKGTFSPKRNPDNVNPYSQGGLFSNCAAVLCGPVIPSTLRRREFVGSSTQDVSALSAVPQPPPSNLTETSVAVQVNEEAEDEPPTFSGRSRVASPKSPTSKSPTSPTSPTSKSPTSPTSPTSKSPTPPSAKSPASSPTKSSPRAYGTTSQTRPPSRLPPLSSSEES